MVIIMQSEPELLPYLKHTDHFMFNIDLEVHLKSESSVVEVFDRILFFRFFCSERFSRASCYC